MNNKERSKIMSTKNIATLDALGIQNGLMTTEHFTKNFIAGKYNNAEISAMLLYHSGYFSGLDNNRKKTAMANLFQFDIAENDRHELMTEYYADQSAINRHILQALYDVIYEHSNDSPSYITRYSRLTCADSKDPITAMVKEKPDSCIAAMQLLGNVFSNNSHPYLYTLPPYALYEVFYAPRKAKDNMRAIQNTFGFNSNNPQTSNASALSSAFLNSSSIENAKHMADYLKNQKQQEQPKPAAEDPVIVQASSQMNKTKSGIKGILSKWIHR